MAQSNLPLAGKRVVVIGGASGIGFAVAELAQAQGASVVIGSSNPARVSAAAARLKDAAGHAVDVRDEAAVAAFFEIVGAYDHLAVTAGDWGGFMFGATRDIDIAQAQAALGVRFWGVIAAVKYGCRTIARDGSITLTSGVLAQRPMKGAPLTTAIGGAVERLAIGLAMDLAPVRVNAVCPGLVLTEHVESQYPEAARTAMVATLPVPRVATPVEAASAYVYLMQNGYTTGQILPVDGGRMIT